MRGLLQSAHVRFPTFLICFSINWIVILTLSTPKPVHCAIRAQTLNNSSSAALSTRLKPPRPSARRSPFAVQFELTTDLSPADTQLALSYLHSFTSSCFFGLYVAGGPVEKKKGGRVKRVGTRWFRVIRLSLTRQSEIIGLSAR